MPYADAEFYNNTYKGTAIPVEELDRALVHASDQIDSMTYNRIRAVGFESLTSYQQERVKLAVCAQADFYKEYGGLVDVPLHGFSAGKISLSFAGERINGIATSRTVSSYLSQSGLSDRRL